MLLPIKNCKTFLIVSNSLFALIAECVSRHLPLSSLTSNTSIALHYCIYACKAELDEIRRGLDSLGFVGLMTQYPCLMSLFKASSQKLTANMLQNLFSHTFSLAGSNSHAKEQQIMMHVLELLHDVEGKYGMVWYDICI